MSKIESVSSLFSTVMATAFQRGEHVSQQPRIKLHLEDTRDHALTITTKAARELAAKLVALCDWAEGRDT